jgi:GNAT superfamily N-acetyltransferase
MTTKAHGPGWTIRKATEEDLEDVVRLRRELVRVVGGFTSGPSEQAWTEATWRYLVSALPAGRFHAWLARADGGEAVACGGLVPFERPPGPNNLGGWEGYVLNMYTAPGWRRRGVSRAVLAELMRHARELGLGRLWLHASSDGRPLYEQMGFQTNPIALEWQPPSE